MTHISNYEDFTKTLDNIKNATDTQVLLNIIESLNIEKIISNVYFVNYVYINYLIVYL